MKQHAGFSRRWLLGATAALPLGARAAAERRLRVLAWPGYADPDVVERFQRRTGVRVEVSFIDSDDALWQRMSARNGADFDVFAANTAEILQGGTVTSGAAQVDNAFLGFVSEGGPGATTLSLRGLGAVLAVQELVVRERVQVMLAV